MAIKFGSDKRIQEFTTGRAACRLALIRSDLLPAPIGKGEQGEPLWPPSAVGSLAHDNGLAACLVAERGKQVRSLGLDFELLSRGLSPKLYSSLFSEQEVQLFSKDFSWKPLAGFCIKEAIYKCLFPITREFIRFDQVQVTSLDKTQFSANYTSSSGNQGQIQKIKGVIHFGQGRIFAAAGVYNSGDWLGGA